MSDNIDDDQDVDFEDEIGFGDDDNTGFDDYGSSSGSLGELWRNNPMVKIGTVLAGVAIIAFAIFLFGGSDERTAPSDIRQPPRQAGIAEEPGIVSPVYEEAIRQKNEEDIEQAIRNQTSNLPLSVNPARGKITSEAEEPVDEVDPLERWRDLQEQRRLQQPVREDRARQIQPQEPQVDTRSQAVNALSSAMATQIEGILSSKEIPELQITEITSVSYLDEMMEKRKEKEEAAKQKREEEAGDPEEAPAVILLPAGEIEYAQLVTEANSDVPGPILANIVSGPLRGAKLIGSFATEKNYLVLNFNQVVIDGISYTAEAVALDPSTANIGVATEVDQRYFTRVVLPAAASFIEGLSSAVAQSGGTTVTVNETSTSSTEEDLDIEQEVAAGFEELGAEVADKLDEISSETEPLIRVAAGTAIGVLFVQPVIEE